MGFAVLTLHELQNAIRHHLFEDADPAAAVILTDTLLPADRLSIYRNTSRSALTTALRLAYPAVHQLVGDDFFAAAAGEFIKSEPPHTAWLDVYGSRFPEFLRNFKPVSRLTYLPDVARLERAVVCAIYAADVEPLALGRLASIAPCDHARDCFVPHPSVSLVSSSYPVDAIWRAVLAHDDLALSAIDLDADAVWLLIERGADAVQVIRCERERWRFAKALFAGEPLAAALDAAGDADAPAWLATHLAGGRFVGFALSDQELTSPEAELCR